MEGVPAEELELREAAFAHCALMREIWGDAVPARPLKCFRFGDQTVFLYAQQGIHRPNQALFPLTLVSTLNSRYQDDVSDDLTTIRYDYSPYDGLNEGVKRASQFGLGFVHLVQVNPKPKSEYLLVSPVFVDGWDDTARTFSLFALPESMTNVPPEPELVADAAHSLPEHEKRTALRLVEQRLGQAGFRKEVLAAQRNRCTVCELRVRPLVDAAHVVPHADPRSTNEVRNGLALCALHHRAFDTDVLRIDPDAVVHVDEGRLAEFSSLAPDALRRRDPAAVHQLLDHHGRPLRLPKDPRKRPDPELLRLRWEGRLGA